jgi:hypothetical protein
MPKVTHRVSEFYAVPTLRLFESRLQLGIFGTVRLAVRLECIQLHKKLVRKLYFLSCGKGDQIDYGMGGTFSTDCSEEIYVQGVDQYGRHGGKTTVEAKA